MARRVAPVALGVGAMMMLGGGALGAGTLFGGGAAAAGTAATTAAGVATAATTTAAGVAATGGLFSGGFLSGIGTLLSNPTVGALISGAAQGWSAGAAMQQEEEAQIAEEERQAAMYAGVGEAAMGLGVEMPRSDEMSSGGGSSATPAPRGLGVMPGAQNAPIQQSQVIANAEGRGDLVNTPSVAFAAPSGIARRPGIGASAGRTPRSPTIRFNPESGQIEFN